MRVSLNSEFKRKCDFLKVNVPLLIKRHVPLYEPEETTVKVMGLTVSISKKNNTVTSLSLSGNNPLDSDIYRTFLQTPISIDEAIPKNCILFFEIPYPRTNQSNLLTPSKLRSRIHINSHGNFIFYVHIGGDNFCIIRTFINYLNDLNALETASTNPFLVIKRVEGLDENNVGS